MKVDTQRADARTQQVRQKDPRDAPTEDAARRFQRQLQRRRKEEEASLVGMAGPFELLTRWRHRPDEPQTIGSPLMGQIQALSGRTVQPAPELAPLVDPEVMQMLQQDSLRMDTIARAAMEAGVKAAMAQDSGEYQVELGSALFARTRLRVRAAEDRGIEVRCESGNASEREWFTRHRETLAERMTGLTGRAVHLDIVDVRA